MSPPCRRTRLYGSSVSMRCVYRPHGWDICIVHLMDEKLVALVAYCVLMAATPGPNTVMLTAAGANFGYRRTLPHLTGVVIGLTLMTLLACLGLSTVFVRFPVLHDGLYILGALYMAYLAWRVAFTAASEGPGSSLPLTFAEAAFFQVVNPKAWIRAVTLATVFMPAELSVAAGALVVSGIGLLIGFAFMTLWTLFGVGVGRFLDSPQRRRLFNGAMGGALLLLAANLALSRL